MILILIIAWTWCQYRSLLHCPRCHDTQTKLDRLLIFFDKKFNFDMHLCKRTNEYHCQYPLLRFSWFKWLWGAKLDVCILLANKHNEACLLWILRFLSMQTNIDKHTKAVIYLVENWKVHVTNPQMLKWINYL